MSRELLKECLSWLRINDDENVTIHDVHARDIVKWIKRVQTELAKPEPEPVAFMHISKTGSKENVWFNNPGLCEDEIALGDKIVPLYINQSTLQHQTHSEQS